MDRTIQVTLMGVAALALQAGTWAQATLKKVVVPKPLPALTMKLVMPGSPSALVMPREPRLAINTQAVVLDNERNGKSNGDLAAMVLPGRPSLVSKDENLRKGMDRAAAPLGPVMVKLMRWNDPHGTYLTELRELILEADASGDFTERDKLLAVYQTWAEKYLAPGANSDNKQRP